MLKVVKAVELEQTLKHFHDSELVGGHRGINATIDKILNFYWFPNMRETVTNWIANCSCAEVS